jgi:hypothetical protein
VTTGWTLDPDSELNVIIPWLDSGPSEHERECVSAYIDGLLRDPFRPTLEGPDDVFSVVVPRTSLTMIWTFERRPRSVYIADIRHSPQL